MDGLALGAGAAALGAQTGLVAWGSWRAARRWWPDAGVTTVVAALVLGIGYVLVALLALGTVGLLVAPAPLLLTGAAALALHRLVPAPVDGRRPPRPLDAVAPLLRTWPGRLGAAGVAAATATVVGPLVDSVVRWRPRFDALSSHLPVLAQMVQRESTWFFPYASPVAFSAHYPANAELVAAWIVVPLGRDFLVQLASAPGLLLLVAATAMLAVELGARPVAAVAAALVVPGSPRAIEELVGTNMQDLQAAGGVLACYAFAARRWRRPEAPARPDLVVAGLAAGIAVGTRYAALLTVAPALVLLVLPVLAGGADPATPGAWRGWFGRWRRLVGPSALAIVAMAVTGAYFYVRNQVFGSSPVYPQSVPWHDVVATERLNFPHLSSYLELGWAPEDWRRALGYVWRFDGPLLFAMTFLAFVPLGLAALRRERSVAVWVWATVPPAAALTFLATPAGPGLVFDGDRVEVFSQALNLRYAIAFVALGAAGAAAVARRLPVATEQAIVGGALLLGAATSLLETRHDIQWAEVLAVVAVLAVALVAGLRVLASGRLARRGAGAVGVAVLVVGAALAPAVADRFDERRLSSGLPYEGARLALVEAGIDGPVAAAGFCRIYGLYGPALDGDVEFLTGDDDGIDRPLAATADAWLASLAEHDVEAVVLGSDICYSELDLPYAGWVEARPEVFEPLVVTGDGSVYLVHLP